MKCSNCPDKEAVNESAANPGMYYCYTCANYVAMEFGFHSLKPLDKKRGDMRPFWDNLFFDLDEGNIKKETFAMMAGDYIRTDLRRIEDAIKEYDLKKALALIEEYKKEY